MTSLRGLRVWIYQPQHFLCGFTSRLDTLYGGQLHFDVLHSPYYRLELVVFDSHQRFQNLKQFIRLAVLRLQ
jgi:hypothetical protein